jgi:hypothetical protein
MESGSFVGTTPCPQPLGRNSQGQIACPQPCNVYLLSGTLDEYVAICSGSQGQHQQFFGAYYLPLVSTGSSPAW